MRGPESIPERVESWPEGLLSSRRKVLKTAVGTGVTVIGLGAASPTAAQEIEYGAPSMHYASDDDPPLHATNILVLASSEIDFNGTSQYTVEVERMSLEESVVFEPSEHIQGSTDWFNLWLYDGDGTLLDPPELRFGEKQYPLSVAEGDQELFVGGNVFDYYRIHLLDSGERIDSTEEILLGIGYEGEFEQHGTSGEIEVTFPIEDEVDDSWYVRFSVRDHSYSPPRTLIEETEMERDEENNRFVASFHEDDLGELNNDSVPQADIRFYERGNPAESDDSYEPDLWVGFSMTFDNVDEGGVGAVFRRSAAATDSPIVRGLVGAGGLGATYLGYKKLKETGSESTDVEPSEHGIKEREERNPKQRCNRMDPLITDYDDLSIEEPIDRTSQVSIQRASANGHQIWVLTPSDRTPETIDTAGFGAFVESIKLWQKVDPHPHLVDVYAVGTKPHPWAAIQPAEAPSLSECSTDLSLEEILNVLGQVCEAVHHVQRYGQTYERLSASSVLVDNEASATLRGVLDYINDDAESYTVPDSDENRATEQADVYRLGALAYEVLTGQRPETPTPTPPSEYDISIPADLDGLVLKALDCSSSERHETVLHFRDGLEDVRDAL